MKTELIDVSPTRKEIKIEIEPQQVREAYDRMSEQYMRGGERARLPPGTRTTFSRSHSLQERDSQRRFARVTPDAVNDAIDEHSLAAIGEPDVHFDNTEELEQLGEEPINDQSRRRSPSRSKAR